MTAYTSGRALEHRCRAILEAEGYVVTRAAGSKSKADLVAFGHGHTLVVQVKGGARPIGSREWNALVDLACAGGAIPVLAEKHGPRTPLEWWRLDDYRKTGSRHWPRTGWLFVDAPSSGRVAQDHPYHPAGPA